MCFKVHIFWEGHKISTLLSYVVPVQSKVEILQNFVAFSEYMNFNVWRLHYIRWTAFTWKSTWVATLTKRGLEEGMPSLIHNLVMFPVNRDTLPKLKLTACKSAQISIHIQPSFLCSLVATHVISLSFKSTH